MPQVDNPRHKKIQARKEIRASLGSLKGTMTASQLRDVLNLLIADISLDSPEVDFDTSVLPAVIKAKIDAAK